MWSGSVFINNSAQKCLAFQVVKVNKDLDLSHENREFFFRVSDALFSIGMDAFNCPVSLRAAQ
ncbi:MAG: hypothetical protein CVT94_18015 [Bacteroidetes bacterium HGW-Bacteroidetes-11]|nr:MAG: hypothetical protein CVT94_18015 [Bacteroidetes bacterium HGW-Bacteroidetes-11]